jgi:hypothetical protein
MDTVVQRVDLLDANFADFKEWARLHAEKMDRDYAEMKREARQHTLEWAQLAERFGRFAEDIVAPNIPRLAREVFGITEPEFSGQRIEKRHAQDPSRFREFDLIHAGQRKVIVVETKATAPVKYIDDFAELAGELGDYFPEMKDYAVIPIFASLSLSGDFIRRLSRLRIYGLALGERTMELVNLAEVSARRK